MNKKFIATIVALILTFEGFSQILIGNSSSVNNPLSLNESVNDISFTQEFSYLKVEKMTIKGREFYHLDMGKDFVPSYKIGQAELPVYTSLIDMPFCERVSIEGKVLEKRVFKLKDNILIAPKQISQSKQNEDIGFSMDEKYYNRNSFGEEGRVKVEGLGIMGGSNMARLTVSPIRYNPATNEIEVATKIQVTVHFVGADYSKTINLKNKMGRCFNDFTQAKVINKNLSATVNSTNITRPYKMVIVSNIMFQSTLQPFIKWKKQEGFNVIEAYTSQANVGTTTTSIKAYLKGLYDNATTNNPAPDYILIVGDIDKVPTFTGSYAGSGETQYTDLYYAEYTNDMLPEAFYGRMSAETTTQLTNILNKTISYEKYQMSDDSYLNRILLIAGKEVNEPAPTVGNGQINYAKQYFNGLDTTIYYNPACGTTANQAQVKQDINEGQGWVNYSAHCSEDGWYIPSYLVSDVSAMTNTNKYGIFINNCCLSGKYDVSECFTESLLRAQNKGAIGAIGGSNYTYWYEDYYWAVGSKAANVNPSYDANNLGMYDRFFHTHGEAKSKQYTTMGQMIPAGNLAVVAMNSSLINYYWEIYNLEGDPSLMPYVGQGLTFNNSAIPSSLPIGAQTLSFTTVPYTYVALSKNDSLLCAMEADSNGNVSMDISSIAEVGYVNIVLTHQFYKPLIDSINFITSNAPYITLNNVEFVNSQTNEVASKLEENTSYYMNIELVNLGSQPLAFSSNALTLGNTSNVNITNNTVSSLTTIGANDTISVNNCFAFTTTNGISDNTVIPFIISIAGTNYNRQQTLNKTVSAPNLDINSLSLTINNDTITLNFKIANIGSRATANNSTVSISDINNIATIIGSNTNNVNSLNTNGSANESFSLLKTNSNDNTLSFKLHYVAGNYQVTKNYSIAVNGQIETFESNSFTAFAWNNNTNHWTIDSTTKHNGSYSARSAVISDSQTSDLSINVNCLSQDTISFYVKVSSEQNYDLLHFYIDGVEQLSLSGSIDWTKESFVVSSGQHTFLWEYAKDYSQSSGSDCAWIDDVKLPISGTTSGLNNITTQNIVMYPNPTKDNVQINNLKENSNIMIIDNLGRMRYNKKANTSSLNINLNMEQGVYYVVIKDSYNKVYSTQKLIIK